MVAEQVGPQGRTVMLRSAVDGEVCRTAHRSQTVYHGPVVYADDPYRRLESAALHGAAFRGLNEVVEHLVANGADIDARDFRGRTAYRMAEGSKQSFQFQSWPETAGLFDELGADTKLGIPGTVQERLRDVVTTGEP